MRILVVEDEDRSVVELIDQIVRFGGVAHDDVDIARDFHSATRHLNGVTYGLVVTDLLLLPAGSRLLGAEVVDAHEGALRRFSPSDWNSFVISQGGVGVLRHARYSPESMNYATPFVVASWFDDLPGFRRVARMLDGTGEDLVTVVPKPARVRQVGEQLPASQGYQVEEIEKTVRGFWHALIQGRGGPSSTTLLEAAAEGDRLRALLRAARLRALRANDLEEAGPGRADGGVLFPRIRTLETTAVLTASFDLGDDPLAITAVFGSDDERHYGLRSLYESWDVLRDWVLLNPASCCEVLLSVLPVHAADGQPHRVDLGVGSHRLIAGTEGWQTPNTAERICLALIDRCLLAFLAHASEPWQSLEDGWSISEQDLLSGAFGTLASLNATPHADDGVLTWPGVPEGIPIAAAVAACDTEFVRSRLRGIQAVIRAAVEPGDFQADDIVVPCGTNMAPRGWYFNGDLELSGPQRSAYVARAEEAPRLGLIVTHPDISFVGLDDRRMGLDELQRAFERSGVPPVMVRHDADEATIADMSYLEGVSVILIGPVSESDLRTYLAPERQAVWRRYVAPHDITTLLLLEPRDRFLWRLSPEDLRSLGEINIHLMYPGEPHRPYDATKILDHVICSAFRTRYESVHDETERPLELGEVHEHFLDIVEYISDLGYDGDATSGAISHRSMNNDGFWITTTKSDKFGLRSRDVAFVQDYDIGRNRLTWKGSSRPSSSSPWHGLIYRAMPRVNWILHTHWKAITHSDVFSDHRTPRYVPCGSVMEAADIVRALRRQSTVSSAGGGLAILAEHGEAFVADSPLNLKRHIESAIQRLDGFLGDEPTFPAGRGR